MPHVQRQPKAGKNYSSTRQEINDKQRPALARDDLREAFAGKENNGPTVYKTKSHSTNLKSRKTKASKFRTPKR